MTGCLGVGKYSLHGAYGWLFEKGDEQLPSYIVGIKISHDIRIIVWPIWILWFMARMCVFQHCWIDRWFVCRMGVSVVWALMRTFSLMTFFQTKLDLDGWVIGSCYGTVMKTSKFLFPETTLAVHKKQIVNPDRQNNLKDIRYMIYVLFLHNICAGSRVDEKK